jgi:hypothetical protein
VNEQAVNATGKLGESLRSLSDELRSMGEGSGTGSGPAAELARTVAGKGDAVATFLDGKQPGELLQDLRSYASRNPGTFLLGALAAGVVAGRFVRGAKADSDTAQTPNAAGTPSPYTPGVGTPSNPSAPGLTGQAVPPALPTVPYGTP